MTGDGRPLTSCHVPAATPGRPRWLLLRLVVGVAAVVAAVAGIATPASALVGGVSGGGAVGPAAAASPVPQLGDVSPCGGRDSRSEQRTEEVDPAYTDSGLEDCAGNPVSFYVLHYDDGLSINPADADRQIPSLITRQTYSIGRAMTRWSIYVLSFGLTLPLIDYGASWAQEVERVLSVGVLDQIGIVPLFLVVAVIIGFLWMFRGAYALGIWELVLSFVLAAVATGALISPYQFILGDDGAVETSRELGVVFAHCMHNEAERSHDEEEGRGPPPSSPDAACWGGGPGTGERPEEAGSVFDLPSDNDALVTEVVERQLVDVMIRKPHQLMNFGRVVDGHECEDEYNAALREAETPEEAGEQMYRRVTGCDDQAKAVADSPGEREIDVSRSFLIAALGMFVFALASGVTLAFYSFLVLVHFVIFVPQLVLAVLPGSARLGLWRTLADVLATCFMIMVHIMTIQATMIGVTSLLTPTSAGGLGSFGLGTGLLWVVAGILIFRFSAHRRAISNGIAAILAKRPLPPGQAQLVVPASKTSQGWRGFRLSAFNQIREQATHKIVSKTPVARRILDRDIDLQASRMKPYRLASRAHLRREGHRVPWRRKGNG